MTSLLLQWLNEELELHRKVRVLERDLCNGYIFAEVLHLHGLETHLERYTDELDVSTRLANLETLGNAMAAAGLGELGLQTKRQVMMEDRSTISQLLLRIKEFIESKRAKISIQQQKLMNIPSKVYDPRSPPKDPTRVVQDVEERFIKETAKAYHPTEVRFYKDVNSAIYLRKFPQAQWQAENELIQWEEKMKAETAKQSANSMTSLRARMKEKRAFMKEWDQQRLEKWQQTQKLYLAAERDDLRLELTLEERRRRLHAAKLAETQVDAKSGIVGFERNMSRLGLGNGGGAVEPKLRAIPVSDTGALAHLEHLEERVKELGFRPSNNVQMMKELRARRAAQLAAEKDRRMRRMKAASDANRTELTSLEEPQSVHGADESTGVEGTTKNAEQSGTSAINIQDAFVEANREALEENYSRLREIGATKRELDTEELLRLRLQKRSKTFERNKKYCVEIVDDLISLSIMCTEREAASDTVQYAQWKRKTWLEKSSSALMSATTRPSTRDDQDELEVLTQTFVSLSNSWEAYMDPGSNHLDGMTVSVPGQVESFVRTALATPSPELLDTTWTKLNGSKFIVVYTSDERGHKCARDVATDHSLHYINIDDLFEECVKNSYDPVKQADLAATFSRRERELGAFGPKIAALRQKNAPIPESLVVEIVTAVVASEQPEETPVDNTTGTAATQAEPDVVSSDLVGFLFHNFPRSLEEWKLFEKAIINTGTPILPDEVKADRLAALESAFGASPAHFESSISCAVSVSLWEPLSRTPSPSTPGLTPSSSSTEVSQSTAERRRQTEASKRQSVVDPAVAKAEAEQELQLRRRQVEEVLARTSRTIRIDQENMHERALQELIHLVIEVYTSEAFSTLVGALVECGTSAVLPNELETARENRRLTMPIEGRIAWMVASKQLQLNPQALFDVVMRLHQLENAQSSNLHKLFKEAFGSMEKATLSTQKAQKELDDILGTTASQCQAALQRAKADLSVPSARAEKILTATEVAMGDAADAQRLVANHYVDDQANKSHQFVQDHLLPWTQLLPLVCLELKEFVVDTVDALRGVFYEQFGFLRAADTALPVLVPQSVVNTLIDSAKMLDQSCELNRIPISLQPEVLRIATQLATTVATDAVEVSSCPRYELEEIKVAQVLTIAALQRMTAVLRWSTRLVDSFKSLHATETEAMSKYIRRDLRVTNLAITRVMKQLCMEGSASWPETPRLGHFCPRPLLRHQRLACLSAAHVKLLVEAFVNANGTIQHVRHTHRVPRDAFTATVVDVSRRACFPDVWQDPKNIARVSIAWSSDHSESLPWRHVLFALICEQVVDFPTIEALELATAQLRSLSAGPHNSADDDEPRVSRADFLTRTTLWFEGGCLAAQEAAAWKDLIFSLFTTDSSGEQADVFSMLFTFCVAPANPRHVCSELASTILPRFSRGLRRALAVLSQWTAASSSGSVGTPRVSTTQLRPLFAFAGVEIDDTQLTGASSNEEPRTWKRQDVLPFLAWCEAHDPAIAHAFTLHDTLTALVDD